MPPCVAYRNQSRRFLISFVIAGLACCATLHAAENDGIVTVTGTVQNQDLRRVAQAVVEMKNQEGTIVSTAVTNEAGEFRLDITIPGTYSISAVQETYRSEYIVLQVGAE